ncbi:helicase-primase primase subunit [Proboscivirus elephantidbeta5]|uniref:Helicase-primase primase subunit n=1 Tax=Elephant endotheliotropic herpesvirus 5 TaxID=768738 RepID=A0A075CZS9_9BETA|nr:helicase-primase primase subunit [Elephant endotheliotropic herpesvirus 5]AHC02834.1 helicase-primase primase subunit [Elephant endotheliotropic herpesvirus 5]
MTIQVLFATEYDSANIVISLLCGVEVDHYVYPILYKRVNYCDQTNNKYGPSKGCEAVFESPDDDEDSRLEASGLTTIEFCLQTQSCEDSVRMRPVFFCHAHALNFETRYKDHEVLGSATLLQCLDESRTLKLYRQILDEITADQYSASDKRNQQEPANLRHLVYFHRDVLVKYLTENFIMPTSPSWFISVFGTYEASLILTMHYYLLERQYSTVQTTQHYAKCFTRDLGRPLVSCYAMKDFMTIVQSSRFLGETRRFANYCKFKNERDFRELRAIDSSINAFRQSVCLTEAEHVHFMYLAFGTALSKTKFLDYTLKTSLIGDLEQTDNRTSVEPCSLGRSGSVFGYYENNMATVGQGVVASCDRSNSSSGSSGFYSLDSYEDSRSSDSGAYSLYDSCYLSHNLKKDLLNIMELYFTPASYLNVYIKVHKHESREPMFQGYTIDTESTEGLVFSGTSNGMSERLRKGNKMFEGLFDETESDGVSSVLNIIASSKEAILENNEDDNTKKDGCSGITKFSRREIIFPGLKHPAPMYRTDGFQNMQITRYFSIVGREDWKSNSTVGEVIETVPDEYVSDERLTESVWVPDTRVSSPRLSEQLYRSRHEMFNDRLPVYNFVGDVDLKITNPVSKEWFFAFCRNIRRIILETFSYLFEHVDPDVHPVYFFKSQCETEPGSFCGCLEKIGLRIITPLPKNTCILGGKNVKHLCDILNHVMFLDKEMFPLVNAMVADKNCFDSGIYSHGKSVRLPLMSKVDESLGFLRNRLLPVFIVPDSYRRNGAHKQFVRDQLNLANWLHHNPSDNAYDPSRSISYVLSINDVGRSQDASFIDHKLNKLLKQEYVHIDSIIENFKSKYGVTETTYFIETVVWPHFLRTIKNNYSSTACNQFNNVCFDDTSWPCVQLFKIHQGTRRNFYCIQYDHKDARENVHFFLDFRPESSTAIWTTLWSRCFSRKCKSNAKNVHVSHKITIQQ